MIVDTRMLPDGSVVEADLCIVGAGAAGISMAIQLSGRKLAVSIVESGGLKLDKAVQALAGGEQSGVPYFPLDATRYRILGGSTFRWGARTAPLKPSDFVRRSWVPYSGWPISHDALDRYYERAFELVGLHRPFKFDEDVWTAFDLSPPAVDPAVLNYSAFQFGKNLLLGQIWRRQLRDARNITVHLNANALSLRSNARGDHVDGVEVGTLAGQRYMFKARGYVLACGGIENPRLLLASSSVNPAGLCNDHGAVGRYFMEHPTASAGTIVSAHGQRLQDTFSPGLVAGRLVEVGLALSPQLQEARQSLNAVVRVIPVVTRDATQALREMLWHLNRRHLPEELTWRAKGRWLAQRLGAVARDPFRIVVNVLRHAAGKPKRFRSDSLLLEVRTEQEPNPDSRVTLADGKDAFGQRRAHLHWALTGRDKHTMRVAAVAFDGEIRRLGLGELHMAPWLHSDELVWPSEMVGGHHHMGTTRMSDDARAGIVDGDCRAHAVDNLYIAGSSVFPTAGYVNPTATLLALAIRLAEHLEERYARRRG